LQKPLTAELYRSMNLSWFVLSTSNKILERFYLRCPALASYGYSTLATAAAGGNRLLDVSLANSAGEEKWRNVLKWHAMHA